MGLGLLVAFWPVLRWYVLRLDDGTDEPWGLVALATAAGFGWRSFVGEVRLVPLLLGVGCYAVGFPFLSPLPRALLAVSAVVVGFNLVGRAPGVAGLLYLSLPVLATAQFYFGWPLRWIVAVTVEGVLSLGGTGITREGVVLAWEGVPVSVDGPCSGIRMLWAGLFVHFTLCAFHRFDWRMVASLTPLALISIVAANIVRAFVLVFPESGRVEMPGGFHEGTGVAVFLVLVIAMGWAYGHLPVSPARNRTAASDATPLSLRSRGWLAIVLLAAASVPLVPRGGEGQASPVAAFPGWPETWEGELLRPIPLTAAEEAFSSSFPGKIAVFESASGRRLILRWVVAPTRKLHSSADCLRASGFRVDRKSSSFPGDSWLRFEAHHADLGTWRVRERITAGRGDGDAWAEVGDWFWAASWNRTTGPWWAVTVMEPLAGG